jgi:hypothetical protein
VGFSEHALDCTSIRTSSIQLAHRMHASNMLLTFAAYNLRVALDSPLLNAVKEGGGAKNSRR